MEAKNYVAKDGYLIYSVCTFNPDETYLLVEKFLTENPEFEELEFADGNFVIKERKGFFITSGDVIYAAILRRKNKNEKLRVDFIHLKHGKRGIEKGRN